MWPTALCVAAVSLHLHVTLCVYFLISIQSSTHKWGVNDPNVAPEAPTSDEPDGDSR